MHPNDHPDRWLPRLERSAGALASLLLWYIGGFLLGKYVILPWLFGH